MGLKDYYQYFYLFFLLFVLNSLIALSHNILGSVLVLFSFILYILVRFGCVYHTVCKMGKLFDRKIKHQIGLTFS